MDLFDTDQINDLLEERWSSELAGDRIRSSAIEHHKRICLRICIDSADERYRWIMEAGLSRPDKTADEPTKRDLIINFLDAYLAEWFESKRSTRLSLNFCIHEFAGHEIFLRGRRRDLKADQLAAEFLGEPLEPDLEEID